MKRTSCCQTPHTLKQTQTRALARIQTFLQDPEDAASSTLHQPHHTNSVTKPIQAVCTNKQFLIKCHRMYKGRGCLRQTLSLCLSVLDTGARCGGCSAPRFGRFNQGKDTRYPLYRELGRPQGRSGWVKKSHPQREWIPDPASP